MSILPVNHSGIPVSNYRLPSRAFENEEIDRAENAVRELLKNEGELLNCRMNWLLQTQSILLAALAFTWDNQSDLVYILSWLGIAVAISIGMMTSLVTVASRDILTWWETNVPAEERARRLVIGLDKPSRGFRRYLRPYRALPIIFSIAWLAVIISRWLG